MWTDGNIPDAAKLGSSMQFSCMRADENGPQQDFNYMFQINNFKLYDIVGYLMYSSAWYYSNNYF